MITMDAIEHDFQRGWKRYGFDNLPFSKSAIHGSDQEVSVCRIFDRGYKKAHISFATVYPSETDAIGMHMHRDLQTKEDMEEWYIIIDGEAETSFSNGDTVECKSGDMIAIYPGTGHSFRAINGPCRIISITPEMFHYINEPPEYDRFPEQFDPQIVVTEINPESLCALKAICSECGAEWVCPTDDNCSSTLSVWAREHRHGEQEVLK